MSSRCSLTAQTTRAGSHREPRAPLSLRRRRGREKPPAPSRPAHRPILSAPGRCGPTTARTRTACRRASTRLSWPCLLQMPTGPTSVRQRVGGSFSTAATTTTLRLATCGCMTLSQINGRNRSACRAQNRVRARGTRSRSCARAASRPSSRRIAFTCTAALARALRTSCTSICCVASG